MTPHTLAAHLRRVLTSACVTMATPLRANALEILLPQEKNAPKIPLQVSLLVRFVESCLICNVHYISMYFLLLCASSLAGFSRYRNPNPSKNIIGALPLKSFFSEKSFWNSNAPLTAHLQLNRRWYAGFMHLEHFLLSDEGPEACFSKVPIINGPGKLLPFTLKIEVSMVLHPTW